LNKKVCLSLGLWLCLLAVASIAAGFSKPPTTTPATAQFGDLPGDGIRSDGQGAYFNRVDGVKAIIDGVGDFDLDTNVGSGPTARTLCLDFSTPVPPNTVASAPFTSGCVDSYLSTGSGDLLQMSPGTSKNINLAAHFAASGFTWFVEFNPTTYSGTSTVSVTRSPNGTFWTIEAAAPTDTAKLLSQSSAKGRTIVTDHGNFYLPMRLTVTLM